MPPGAVYLVLLNGCRGEDKLVELLNKLEAVEGLHAAFLLEEGSRRHALLLMWRSVEELDSWIGDGYRILKDELASIGCGVAEHGFRVVEHIHGPAHPRHEHG